MNGPRVYTPAYESMALRWAVLAAHRRFKRLRQSGLFRAVEIGIGSGVTTAILVKDLASDNAEFEYFGVDNLAHEDTVEYAETVYGEDREHKNVFLRIGNSWEVAHQVPNPVHFLFIDGDHHYAAVRKDADAYCPKVPVGFILAMHDVAYTGAKLVIHELIRSGDWRLILHTHEPVGHPDLTPGMAILERVK